MGVTQHKDKKDVQHRKNPAIKSNRQSNGRSMAQVQEIKSVSDGFHLLCEFLNFNFQSTGKLIWSKNEYLPLLGYRWGSIFHAGPQREKARLLQAEIKHELKFLHAKKLVDKLNEMNLTYMVLVPYEDYKFLKKEIPGFFSSWQKVTKIGDARIVLKRSYFNSDSLRKRLYGILLRAVEDCELLRLRCCSRCRAFFVAEKDPREEFCNQCHSLHVRRSGIERIRRFRERKKACQEVAQRLADEGRNVLCFTALLKKARAKTVKEQQEIGPIVKKLGNGIAIKGWSIVNPWLQKQNAGVPDEKIWGGLSGEIRRLLKKSFEEDGTRLTLSVNS